MKLLIIILVLAATLRLWNLGNVPPSLTVDETALGYNAYSILKTARDEHGRFLPLIFESFGDWKPGLYIYTAVPTIAIFGLNEFATRLPGAISGVVAVWLIYLLSGELFVKRLLPQARSKINTNSIQLFSCLFLAISPWHLQFSRGAWEAGMSLTLTLAGIYFFLRAIRDKPSWLIFSGLFFGSTLITYQGAKLATGIVILILLVLWGKNIVLLSRKIILLSFLVGTLIGLPAITSVLTGKAGRLEVFSVFSYPRPERLVGQILRYGNETKNSTEYILFHSEQLNFARGVLGRWMNHFSPRFLFFEGDWQNPQHGVPNAGVLLFTDLLFLVGGFILLLRLGGKKSVLFLLFWLVFAPFPAALSKDNVHAIRALNGVLPLTIILACGATFILEKLNKLKPKMIIYGLLLIVYCMNFVYFLDQYFVHAPIRNAKYWQYGHEQIVEVVVPLQNKYDKIVIAQSYAQPYIYFLFYQKYDPLKYQEDQFVVKTSGGLDVGLVNRLNNLEFKVIDWHFARGISGVLFIGNPEQIPPSDSNDPSQFKIIEEIKYPDKSTAFRLVEVL